MRNSTTVFMLMYHHHDEHFNFQNKENFGPPPYQNPPSSLRASRQSEPILPQPPIHHPGRSSAGGHHVRRDVFPDRLSTSSSYARLQPHAQPHAEFHGHFLKIGLAYGRETMILHFGWASLILHQHL